MSALSHILLFNYSPWTGWHSWLVRPESCAGPFVQVGGVYGVHADLTQPSGIHICQQKGLF